MFESQLSTLVTYNPISVSTETSLDELVRMLDQMGFHHWPVVERDGDLVGIVSEFDVVRALEERHAAALSPTDALGESRRVPSQAQDLMQRRVITIRHDDSPHDALATMLKHRIHSLPVVERRQLQGIVTSSDFLREFSYGGMPACRKPVSSLMAAPAEPVDIDATLNAAYQAMQTAGAEYLPIVQGDFPLGVVSHRGVRKARCRQTARDLGDDSAFAGPTTLAELIADSPTVRPGCTLGEAATIMVERQLQAVAVVNQANRLVGVLSEDELGTLMLAESAAAICQ